VVILIWEIIRKLCLLKKTKEIQMSRSLKRTPITGMTDADSEKNDKRIANRKLRRSTRQILSLVGIDCDPIALPTIRDVSNVAIFAKGGKQWLEDPDIKDLMK
jgi:hypothetical protein